MHIIVDGKPIAANQEPHPDDMVLSAMLKAGLHPTGGGTLCCSGDCPHCLATVDGVSYVRTCQVPARPGMVVRRDHLGDGYPPLPTDDRLRGETPTRNLFCDVVVIGMGESGAAEAEAAKAAGKSVIALDSGNGEDAIGVYAGPLVVARVVRDGHVEMWQIHVRDEIVVATGAAELQPVVPGSELAGLLTTRAAEQLAATGVDLGTIVAIGTPPAGLATEQLTGTLVRFEDNGQGAVGAVVMQDEAGNESRHPCDTAVVGLGLHPRDALYLMGKGLPVRVVGEAATEATVPPCPTDPDSLICACSGVTLADLDFTWESGFREMELIKRSTLAGTGTCQGMGCIPYLRSFIQARAGELQPRFTARPVNRQLTLGEIAAGAHHRPTARTALDGVHRALGAQMERSGGWWRPWNYGDLQAEYWAVREAVSIMDVSTLGKMIVSGPDALEFLERLYPTQVATIKAGRTRYALLLNEKGYVMDDGLIGKESDTRYTLTFTSGGTSFSEMWLRDWATGWGMDVRILNQTYSLGAINVTGPLATQLLERAGLEESLRFMRFTDTTIVGVPCRVFRLSFTGEVSYELHHPAEYSVELWEGLMTLGADLGIRPHGLEALVLLRLEKGHVIVGQDTDYDSTPRRIHHEWMVNLEKLPATPSRPEGSASSGSANFVGRTAVVRTNKVPLDKMLVGFALEEGAPAEGAVIWHNGEFAGHVTSAGWSPVLGQGIALGWLRTVDGELPTEVTIDDMAARRVETPFYDKEGTRARA